MCTLVLLRRPGHQWPLIIAANRDERASRPWLPPARHWPDRPEVVAGLDVLAKGSWLGVNDDGLVAGILNRPGTLGPAEGKRSRGELVLEALDHAEARAAAESLCHLDPNSYRPFNLVVADHREAFWLRHAGSWSPLRIRTSSGTWRDLDPLHMPLTTPAAGEPQIVCTALPDGLSMVTAHDLNDRLTPLIGHFLPRFETALVPDPADDGSWQAWINLLGDRHSPDGDPRQAMNVAAEGDFCTICSQLIALPAFGPPVIRFAAGPPDEAPFARIDL